MVKLALYTAMRLGETSSLTRAQINLEKRTIPLSDKAITALKEALAHPIRPVDTDLLFYGESANTKKENPM